MIFAKALEGQDITAILTSLGAAPAPAGPAEEAAKPKEADKKADKKKGKLWFYKQTGGDKKGKPAEEKKEEKKEEKVEEAVGGIADIFGDS